MLAQDGYAAKSAITVITRCRGAAIVIVDLAQPSMPGVYSAGLIYPYSQLSWPYQAITDCRPIGETAARRRSIFNGPTARCHSARPQLLVGRAASFGGKMSALKATVSNRTGSAGSCDRWPTAPRHVTVTQASTRKAASPTFNAQTCLRIRSV